MTVKNSLAAAAAFALLGLSMGGRNAYHYAGTHPDEVERLVDAVARALEVLR